MPSLKVPKTATKTKTKTKRKRKRKKKKKKKKGPKKPRTAFLYFSAEYRPKIKEANPGMCAVAGVCSGLSIGELTEIGGQS